MKNIKIGDKVRRLTPWLYGNPENHVKEGEIYTIKEIRRDHFVHICLKEAIDTNFGYDVNKFEIIHTFKYNTRKCIILK